MTKVWLVLLAHFCAQFGAHQLEGWIDARLPNGWRQMFKYTLGVMIAAPFFDALMWAFGISEATRRKVALLFFGTFFSGGMGLLWGWLKNPTPIRKDEITESAPAYANHTQP